MKPKKPVTPDLYDEGYFTGACDGHIEFAKTHGKDLNVRLQRALELAGLEENLRVLDIACGRGEIVINCGLQGTSAVGIDYSKPALELARGSAKETKAGRGRVLFCRVDVKNLPFKKNAFDRIFVLDIVEHLNDWELDLLFEQLQEILSEGGRMVVHTMPNAWLSKPLYVIAGVLGIPRGPLNKLIHVNEQDILSLRRVLSRHGFENKVWLDIDPRWYEAAIGEKRLSGFFRRVIGLMKKKPIMEVMRRRPFLYFFGTEVWAIGSKNGNPL